MNGIRARMHGKPPPDRSGARRGSVARLVHRAGAVTKILVLLLCAAFTVSFVNHRIRLHEEDALISPPGQMVTVDGHRMHVFTEGEGERTLVFLAGGGTPSPVLDFQGLYSLLSDDFRIVVVERLGYGYSDDGDEPRDVDTVLDGTRAALKGAGIDGPYVLFPHSMAGLTAIRWAQEHPDEVTAIVGLDAAVPGSYADVSMPHRLLLEAFRLGADLGITRLIPGYADGEPAIASGSLGEHDRKVYRALLYRRTETKPMIEEIEAVEENARVVASEPAPQVPMLFFTSNGDGTGIDTGSWRRYQRDFLAQVPDGEQVLLDSPHYVHDDRAVEIAEDSREFLARLDEADAS